MLTVGIDCNDEQPLTILRCNSCEVSYLFPFKEKPAQWMIFLRAKCGWSSRAETSKAITHGLMRLTVVE